jgi:ribonuclease D
MITGSGRRAEWIDRPEQLSAAIERWRRADPVALDTEFVFERTFRPRLGIVQVAVGEEIALLDAVRLADLSPLAAVFGGAGRKVLHAGSGDVPILRRAAGEPPQPLFDTQVAAAFAGLGTSLSYAALVRLLFGIDLPKHETRTDWLRRPLSRDQLRYAAEDVEHLPAVAAELERRLLGLGRLAWAVEDSAALVAADAEAPGPEQAWRRVKGIERLHAPERAVARSLASWREREADRLDLARPFLLPDQTLLALARRAELPPEAVPALPGFDRRRHAAHARRWVDALRDARAEAAARPLPEDPLPPPAERARLKAVEVAIVAVVAQRAADLALPADLILSRRQRERALAAWDGRGSLGTAIGGFRGELLGADLDRAVTGA